MSARRKPGRVPGLRLLPKGEWITIYPGPMAAAPAFDSTLRNFRRESANRMRNIVLVIWKRLPEKLKKYSRETRDTLFKLTAALYRLLRGHNTFILDGSVYYYFIHWYNMTWRNERAVEIPIAWKMVNNNNQAKILEIGNVLSHYYPVNHDVVDKYEKGPGVINEDVVDFRPGNKYDLIISISTLEHVGWDELPKDSEKIVRAIDNLLKLLSPEGVMLITLPVGENLELDLLVREGAISFTEQYAMRRASWRNEWVEEDLEGIFNVRQAKPPYRHTNGLLVGIIRAGAGLVSG